jgi:hypothetical protein
MERKQGQFSMEERADIKLIATFAAELFAAMERLL